MLLVQKSRLDSLCLGSYAINELFNLDVVLLQQQTALLRSSDNARALQGCMILASVDQGSKDLNVVVEPTYRGELQT